ncbi:uracil-DNA glycosylase family protein [Polaromonas sp. YR568]|uniref:uracil-DNA glycosylase family protein n=1 Tax=Polaromonas sp. YR568 TaxID=1855301 RepID=UPI00313794AF
MSLQLDKRHRAMLREMGVRVWLPMAPPAADLPAEPSIATAPETVATPVRSAPTAPVRPVVAAPAAVPASASAPLPSSSTDTASATAAWALGAPTALYAAAAPSTGPRWLVLVEAPQAVLARKPFQPFEGDAGKLLDNMLRAARLHQGATVHLAPLARLGSAAEPSAALGSALPELMASFQPDVLLVMGRLAGQAVVGSGEPFGRLRGQVHTVQGVRTVLTYDATYLLRSPADKARAWDDLCLVLTVAAGR